MFEGVEMSADDEVGGRRMAERKRHCKREDGSDTDADSDASEKPFWDDEELLTEAMHELISRSNADVGDYLRGDKSALAMANIVHDGLVGVWERPVADYGHIVEDLARKQDAWARAKRSPGVGASIERGEQRGSAS